MPTWRGNTYRFTVTAATAAAGDTYTNDGQTFTVTDAITAGTVLFCTGTGAPTASGNLVRVTGAGTNPIVFSAVTAPNTNWGTSTNWLTDGTGAGVPTQATDAVFDNKSLDCVVNVASFCRNLNFNSGTGYTATINMANLIRVGNTAAGNQSVTLSPGMNVTGSSAIQTIANGTTTLTSNGKIWPNPLFANTVNINGTLSTVLLVDDWTVGYLSLGAGTQNLAISGAFTITTTGSLLFASSNRINSVSGALSTIRMAGTGTWSYQLATHPNLGVNITIDAGVNTVTIANGCTYGGNVAVAGFTFRYISGTVTCLGVFSFLCVQGGVAYNVDVSGSNSPAATTTSSSGVNFDTLRFITAAINSPQQVNVTGTLCAVNDVEFTSSPAGNKYGFALNGGTIYLNKGLTVNAYTTVTTTIPTFIFQGTGTWTENLTVTAAANAFGIYASVTINTTGAITLGSFVGVRSGGFLYTAGSFDLTGFGLRLNGVTLVGFGSGGILIPTLYHTTTVAGNVGGARLTLTDTVPVQITNLIFDGFATNRSFAYAGNIGFIVNNFNYQQTAAVGGSSTKLSLNNSITYVVLNSFIFNARAASVIGNTMESLTGTIPDAILTVAFGASQDVFGMGASRINSSAGQTVWSRKGLLSNATNWQNWTYPKTRFSSFTS